MNYNYFRAGPQPLDLLTPLANLSISGQMVSYEDLKEEYPNVSRWNMFQSHYRDMKIAFHGHMADDNDYQPSEVEGAWQ